MIVKELSHELSEPTIEVQMVELKASGADVLMQITQSKFAAQGIRKAVALDWRPLYIIAGNASSIGTTLVPAGLENSIGHRHCALGAQCHGPRRGRYSRGQGLHRVCQEVFPNVALENTTTVPGYNNAYMIEQVLKRCGDELTRENLLKQATTIREDRASAVRRRDRSFPIARATTVRSTICSLPNSTEEHGSRSRSPSSSTIYEGSI